MKKRLITTLIAIALALGLPWGWYVIAANYDYEALAGTYVLKTNLMTCTLTLRADRTFLEELNATNQHDIVRGCWRRVAEAGVSFSKEFLVIPGEETSSSGKANGEFKKTFGLFPSLTLNPNGPTLRRSFFR